jgi:pimeloyl-ACP methyl ester carboxylesterase
MMLVGAPASSVADNIYYEIRQEGSHRGFDSATTDQAVTTVRALLDAVAGIGSWENAARQYDSVRNQPWLPALNLSPTMKIPPPPQRIEALRRADIYDPAQTLARVTVPTLALYGALDRSVDTAHDAPVLQRAFKQAGVTDFTLRIYPQAGHSLFVSQTGFPDNESVPNRRVPGYTQTMIGWLQARDFTTAASTRFREAPGYSIMAGRLPESSDAHRVCPPTSRTAWWDRRQGSSDSPSFWPTGRRS